MSGRIDEAWGEIPSYCNPGSLSLQRGTDCARMKREVAHVPASGWATAHWAVGKSPLAHPLPAAKALVETLSGL